MCAYYTVAWCVCAYYAWADHKWIVVWKLTIILLVFKSYNNKHFNSAQQARCEKRTGRKKEEKPSEISISRLFSLAFLFTLLKLCGRCLVYFIP